MQTHQQAYDFEEADIEDPSSNTDQIEYAQDSDYNQEEGQNQPGANTL
jgi:hypothetical protein